MTMYATDKLGASILPTPNLAQHRRRRIMFNSQQVVMVRTDLAGARRMVKSFDPASLHRESLGYHTVGANYANPILCAFRVALEHSVSGATVQEVARDWAAELQGGALATAFDEARREHARLVLARLAAL